MFKIDPAQDSFDCYIKEKNYYVDKTEIIYEYLEESFESKIMFTRPRRFGKTMIMTMFRDFLDNTQKSEELFKGLKIMEHKDLVNQYMNKYPVLFLSLKDVKGSSFEDIYDLFRNKVCEVYRDHAYLLSSEYLDDDDKEMFSELKKGEASKSTTILGVSFLCEMLKKHWDKQVFVIIDEYDVPMANAVGTPAYEDVLDMIQKMLSSVCKTNSNVKAVMISGCLYTIKNSSYTGLNNIRPKTILTNRYAMYFGFTDEEVKQILTAAGYSGKYDEVKKTYDGYIFGNTHIYNPWDVMNYIAYLDDNGGISPIEPQLFWANTSETRLNLIHGFLGRTADALEGFEKLLTGQQFVKVINENVPYHQLHDAGNNLWAGLLETGYLTKAEKQGRSGTLTLCIPNIEVMEVFRQEVSNFFEKHVDIASVNLFVDALWNSNAKGSQDSLDLILQATVSYLHAYHEYTYHLVLDGFFTGKGYRTYSEIEAGFGRSDLIIKDLERNRALVLELKHAEKEKDLQKGLKEACDQIKAKKYESNLVYDGYTEIHKYGMAFFDKQCLIKELQ